MTLVIQRTRVNWLNVPGGTAVSTFYFLDAIGGQTALHTFFDAIKSNIPDSVVFSFESGGDALFDDTGVLDGAWSASPPANVLGGAAGGWTAPTGFQMRWETGAIFEGHRVRGRTFIVPTGNIADGYGTMDVARLTAATAAANTLIASSAGNMLVWSRPRAAVPSWTDKRGRVHPAISAHAGKALPVVSANAPNKAVVLTSRRD